MTTAVVGILGTGRMGGALARALAAAGERPLLSHARPTSARPDHARGPAGSVDLKTVLQHSDVVLLAIPYVAAMALVAGPARDGRGRVLVDVTNPRLEGGGGVPAGRSGGELIAAAAPGWQVAKAFNTVPADQVTACRLGDGPVSLPIAGASAAKAVAAGLAERLGFDPLDAGDISASRELESLAVLLVGISAAHRLGGRVAVRIGEPSRPPLSTPTVHSTHSRRNA